MIHALITGKLIKDPSTKTASNGKTFINCLLAVSTDGETAIVSGIAFGDVAERIARMKKGDPLAVVGHIKPTEFKDKASGENRHGLFIVISNVLSVYDIRKRRPVPTPEPLRPSA